VEHGRLHLHECCDPRPGRRPHQVDHLGRPLTAEEAKEQDAANRAKLEKGRTGRFDPYLSGAEKRARAKRSKL
jgi:hypothetical protein